MPGAVPGRTRTAMVPPRRPGRAGFGTQVSRSMQVSLQLVMRRPWSSVTAIS